MIINPFKKYTGSKALLYSLIAALIIALAVIFIYDSGREKSEIYTLYIGGYGNAAYKYSFNTKSGEFIKQQEYKLVNPSFLTLSPDAKVLYAVSENDKNSSVAAFINADGTMLNEAKGSGEGPCYISAYKSHLFTANYNDGSVSVFKTDTSGKIVKALQQIKFVSAETASSHNNSRIHTVRIIKGKLSNNDYLLATDKGGDKIYFFKIERDTTENEMALPVQIPTLKLYQCDTAAINIPKGYGPRHVEFSKNGKYMYLLNEQSGKVMAFTINEQGNNLILKNLQDTIADIYKGAASADIHLAPSGEFLYTSHRRGKDGLSIFKVESNGTLKQIAYQSTGSYPRQFSITPDGEFLFVACQKERTIQVFKVNTKTGFLSNTQKHLTFPDLEPSVVLVK